MDAIYNAVSRNLFDVILRDILDEREAAKLEVRNP
jgi:hypothetical protein